MLDTPRRRSALNYPIGLRTGDSMTQKEFHNIYQHAPKDFKAELIGGTVYIAEPLGQQHGTWHLRLASILDAYCASSPGTQACDNTTVILGDRDEVQPDLLLRILPQYNGQSKDTRGRKGTYVRGAPELVAEVAYSSRSIDLHLKKKRYMRAGVIEYMVLCLESEEITWFNFRHKKEVKPNKQRVLCSLAFPGLWIHSQILINVDYHQSMDILARGLSSPEHADFVSRLSAAANKR